MDEKEKAEKFSNRLLNEARYFASSDYNRDRLPDWIEAAKISVGHIHRTTIFLFSPSSGDEDEFDFRGEISRFAELLTEIPDRFKQKESTPVHQPKITPKDHYGTHFQGVGSKEGKSPIFTVNNKSLRVINTRNSHHTPIIFSNAYIRFLENGTPIASGYIPFAFWVHDYDFEDIDNILRVFRANVITYLNVVHNSDVGNFYEQRKGDRLSLGMSKENSVIVLGHYDGGKHESELETVRNELEAKGYHASLIKELPSHPSQSLPQKVKFWCLSSRFVVVIDRGPSGHIREYTELSKEDQPIALLRQEGRGSTFMVGHEVHTNDFIELFEFKNTPTENIQDIIDWSENFVEEISSIYNEEYPWRDKNNK